MSRLRPAPLSALVLGGLVLLAAIADVPLARLAHQSVDASGGSLPVWISAGFGVVGFVVAWRKPRNLLGWTLLGTAVFRSAGFRCCCSQDGRPPWCCSG
jgi:hypothetical protein